MVKDVVHFSDFNYAYAISNDTLNIRIKVRNGIFDSIIIYYKNLYDHGPNISSKAMVKILDDGYHSLYETAIQVKEKHFKYYFELQKKSEIINYTADGFVTNPIASNFFYYPFINDDEIITPPKWAEGEIIYQVLIDRFFDGDPSNNPQNCKPIDMLPDRETYYGGDFKGIIKKLDYIKSLGTKIIYLSPLFLSPTYHKYDVKDYYKIEDIYGGEEGLIELVQAAHDKDIKIVLDCVFNHCSVENELFQDVIKKGENSKYKDWFFIENFPVNVEKCNYDTFAGVVPTMPKFNTSNQEVIKYLTDAAVYWTKRLNIDGWRLDVADEVACRFWREFNRRLKEINPEILIIGEVWNHATKWMQGDQFDTITNYKYRKWLIDFLSNKIDSTIFWKQLSRNKMLYKTPAYNYLVNLVGSHDTIRFNTLLKNDKIHYLALALMLTMDGIPLIYYGDEVGIEGGDDPDNRRAFRWDDTSKEELKQIQAIGQLRANSCTLKKGSIMPLCIDPQIIAFQRKYKNETLLVIANFSDQVKAINIKINEIVYGQGHILNGVIKIDPYTLIVGK